MLAAAIAAAALAATPAASSSPASGKKALVHHPVSTQSAQAQELFDEGLTLIYAFNRTAAQDRFRAALQADPALAMAWWGVALGAGPNINEAMSDADWKTAREAVRRARALESTASAEERALIDALALRYPASGTDVHAEAYRDAMARVHSAFPADDDAAALYTESGMDAGAFGFNPDGSPRGETAALVASAQGVVSRNPSHPGANHYLIHLYDDTGSAQNGLDAANRLGALPIAPEASHLEHMPGHIYYDLGLFAPMLADNKRAVAMDEEYRREGGSPHYGRHNLDFYLGASLLLGDDAEIDRATQLMAATEPAIVPLIFLRRQRFEQALALPRPPGADAGELAMWHYARGIAFVSTGRTAQAQAELRAIDPEKAAASEYGWLAGDMAPILGARIAYSQGARSKAIARLEAVRAAHAGASPEEFPDWYLPVGEWIGWMQLSAGDAAAAEGAFRTDLARTPHNARSLYGLIAALTAQGKTGEIAALRNDMQANWRGDPAELEEKV